MKKIKNVIIAATTVILLASCGKEANVALSPANQEGESEVLQAEAPSFGSVYTEVQAELLEYFLPLENTLFHYKGIQPEGFDYAVYFDFVHHDTMQFQKRIVAGEGAVVCESYVMTDDAILMTFSDAVEAAIYDFTQNAPTRDYVILKAPLKLGQKWVYGTYDDGTKLNAEITSVDFPISSKAGNFSTIEVTVKEEGDGNYNKFYYAIGAGLVQNFYHYKNGGEFINCLEEVIGDYKMEKTALFPYIDGDKIVPGDDRVSFSTNYDVKELLLERLSAKPSDTAIPAIGGGARMNSLSFSIYDGTVHADFSPELVAYMNANSNDEGRLLDFIGTALCQWHTAEGYLITIDGQPYKSDNLSLDTAYRKPWYLTEYVEEMAQHHGGND